MTFATADAAQKCMTLIHNRLFNKTQLIKCHVVDGTTDYPDHIETEGPMELG